MSFFPFLHFFNSIVYVYLAVYIFIKNPKALLNRLCVAILLCFVVWSFPMVFIHNPLVSKNTARIASDVNSLGWCGFCSFFLWFMLAYSGRKKILEKKWLYPLLFGLPMLFIYKQWTNFLFIDFSMQYYGWRPLWSPTIWPYLYYIYYTSFMIAGLYFNFDFMRKAPNAVLKKQAAVIFFTQVVIFMLGTVTDFILPLANIHIIPNIADTFVLIWSSVLVYAIARYKFLIITPATAADNILSTMYDSLILLNMEGKIITVNNAASELLGYQADELKGKPLDTLFGKEEFTDGLFMKMVTEGSLKNKDLIFKTRQGKEAPMLFSVSTLKDDAGNPAGIVCVAKDISERKKLAEETFKTKELESIGILAGGIAHDFNNLFTIIVGNLSLARDEISPGKKSHRLLLNAEQASLKAAELARKFTAFSPGGEVRVD